MINLDMIGRIQDRQVHLSGIGTGTTLQKTVDEIAPKYELKLVTAE